MPRGIEIRSDEVRSLAFGSIAGSYTLLDSALGKPTRFMIVQNNTNAELMFSFDGVVDHFPLPSNGQIVIDGAANKVTDNGFFFSVGTEFSVRHTGSAPTSGNVYMTAFYGKGD